MRAVEWMEIVMVEVKNQGGPGIAFVDIFMYANVTNRLWQRNVERQFSHTPPNCLIAMLGLSNNDGSYRVGLLRPARDLSLK